MGQACLTSCVNCCEGCRKLARNNCVRASHKRPHTAQVLRTKAMQHFVSLLHESRMQYLRDRWATLDVDCIKCLHQVYQHTPPRAAYFLETLFAQYDESKTGVLSYYETKAFFDDFFQAHLQQSVSMHLHLIVRERFLHMQQLAEQHSVSRGECAEKVLIDKAMRESEAVVRPGIHEAESIYHNQGYLVKAEWIRFCDFEGDAKLHLSELHKTFLGTQAVVFERLSLSLLGLDAYLETARVLSDKIMFGPRKAVAIDMLDSPRVPSEGVVLGFSHSASPHHGNVSVSQRVDGVGETPIRAASAELSGYTPTAQKLQIDRSTPGVSPKSGILLSVDGDAAR
eukprot:TRINITY_DN9425_c0_g1_i1.p1 TRINITY_DN9425_c0_g1~~TRINITY_DN9425_c0_g1_i1.p1  ORF type:complete len:340 (+),score=121.66 TRINITY_DN9425_c0_g1_i1:162-1181(+)